MSKAFNEYLERYGADPSFRELLRSDFDRAISEYALSDEEKAAIREHLRTKAPEIAGSASRVLNEILDKSGRT
jgi:hypothetical protein